MPRVQSLERAMALLEAFRSHETLGIAQMARQLDLPRATVHRLVQTLAAGGYLQQDAATGKYHLGFGLLSLARNALDRMDWRKVAAARMRELAEETGESVYLGVLHHHSVVFIEEVVSSRPVRLGSSLGMVAPLHCTAAGKCILACLDGDVREQLLRDMELDRYTASTITDHQALVEELGRVADQGYGVNDEEWVAGVRYVAAPVNVQRAQATAAISVGAPAQRLNGTRLVEVAEKVKATARRIAADLGLSTGSGQAGLGSVQVHQADGR